VLASKYDSPLNGSLANIDLWLPVHTALGVSATMNMTWCGDSASREPSSQFRARLCAVIPLVYLAILQS